MKGLDWRFPAKKVQFLRMEVATIGTISLVVFVMTYLQFANIALALLFTVIFIGIYAMLSYLTQLVRLVEENYSLTPSHFEVTRKTRFRTRKEKVPLQDIKRYKLDRFFLGGYMLSKNKKHLLYFNTKKELKDFEDFLRKHWKK